MKHIFTVSFDANGICQYLGLVTAIAGVPLALVAGAAVCVAGLAFFLGSAIRVTYDDCEGDE